MSDNIICCELYPSVFNKRIYELHCECFPENNHVFEKHINMIVDMCNNTLSKVLIDKKNNLVIGYILFLVGYTYSEDGYSYLPNDSNIILFNIGIKREYQNKKIGSIFLKQIIDREIKKMNNKNYSIELIVREDNNRAKRVYKKLNFVQKRIIPNHFKNININGLLYSLRLNNK